MISTIVIVGGGAAGWLSAAILAAEFCRDTANQKKVILLVESPDVPTIGVGEGPRPTMGSTLKRVGISEKDFRLRCEASFKQGPKFIGWRSGEGSDSHHHPFTMPIIADTDAMLSVWQNAFPEELFANIANLQSHLIDEGFAPKQLTTSEYAGQFNYGYHLDAGKFAELLKEHCVNKLKVIHVVDYVAGIEPSPDGNIQALLTSSQHRLEGDLFIDCSGQTALPIGCGYRKESWIKNCIAVGMSAGFIEPLEASALVMVELSVNMIRDEISVPKEPLPILSARFNSVFSYRWKRIIEFLKLHYLLSARRGTQYWRDATSHLCVPWHPRFTQPLEVSDSLAPGLQSHRRNLPCCQLSICSLWNRSGIRNEKPLFTDSFDAVHEKLMLERNSLLRFRKGLLSNRELLSCLKKFDFAKA